MQTAEIDQNQLMSEPDYMKPPDINALNGYYTDADSVDQEIFAEERSNLLLIAGDQYNKRRNTFYKQIRDTKGLSEEQKLRITKNHTQRITKIYANNILAMNPGVGFSPKDEQSMHDQKVADIHHSVWRDAVERYDLGAKMEDWVDSFVGIGELAVKLFYDPMLGKVKGYDPIMGLDGQPKLNEMGEMEADETSPILEGEFVFEEIYGFNLLRPPECKDMRKAEWLCVRKMVDKSDLQRKFRDKPDLLSKINSDQDETYMVFDASNGGYKKTAKQTMLREFYFRPSSMFPEGYFYITTKEGILAEGELPGGFFPIVFTAFDKVQTTPRGRSIVKVIRPYQAEINRAGSKMAEHQITLGDDKLLIQNGSKTSAGASLPGVRTVNYTGTKPEVLAGRDGSQYLNYMNAQITELYQVCMVAEDSQESEAQLDPYVLLFRSAKQKKKFQRYISRFERFMIELVKLYINLAKIHLPDEAVIYAAGKNEQINIPEFRELPDTCFEVKIEAQSDDIETKLGKQITMNHALQYVGQQLTPDQIGRIMRDMPFGNVDDSFDDFTLDSDTAMNDILALDRGEQPPINQYDNHPYMIKRLVARTRKADFQFLAPAIQQTYDQKIQMHQQFEAKNQAAIQAAKDGFIPMDGALISVDFYVNAPNTEGGVKQTKAKIPYFAIDWLLKRMEAQGASQEAFENMNQGAAAQMANMITSQPPPGNMNPMAGPPEETPQADPRMAMAAG